MNRPNVHARTVSRRALFGMAGGVAGAALLGGCGGGNGGAGGAGGNGGTGGGGSPSGQLNYWTLLDPNGEDPRGKAERQIFDIFEERTDLTVVEQVIPWQNIDPNLVAAVQAGNPPEVSRINYYNFQMHVNAGSLQPLQEMAERDYSVEELDDFVIQLEGQDGIEALLIENVGNALFLRKDWLAEAGVEAPRTWDEFITVGKALTDVHPEASGFLTFGSTAESGQVAYLFQPMIMGRGGRILNEDGQAAFNEEAGIETYEFLRSLVYEHEIMPSDAATMAYSEQIDAFIAGRVGMIIEGSHRYARILEGVGAENVEVVTIPGPTQEQPSPCSITGWAMAIPQGSPNVEGAWELLKHRTDPQMQEIWAEVAFGLPTRTSTLELPFFQTEESAILRWWLEYMKTNGELTVAPKADAQLNKVMAEAMQEVLLDSSSSVSEVLQRAADQYNAAAS
ncbi:MAG: sugar ABC transporter substrate-binding protein [Actinomycetales bacterium]|nr:sugar ABC transporter substrate-binding protein [Actinomycetales bacterium]